MKFGMTWVPSDLRTYGDLVRATEDIGVHRIGVPDTQASEYRECYVSLSHLFSNTTRVLAGPLVSNPVIRHPAVAAAAIASADELSGGRAYLCMATGDTGVFNLGEKPATLKQLEEYILVLRELFDDGRSVWKGNTLKLKWVERSVPIFIAADGPRTMELAGRVADGLVVGLGLLPENVQTVNDAVARGAAQAGRSIDDIEIWYVARTAVTDQRADAVDLIRPSLASASAHAFRFSLEGKAVPEDLVEPILELERRYDHTVHNKVGVDNPNGRLVEELGLTDYLARRMAVVGTAEECLAQLREMESYGISNVFTRPLVHDRYDFLNRWRQIMEQLESTPSNSGSS